MLYSFQMCTFAYYVLCHVYLVRNFIGSSYFRGTRVVYGYGKVPWSIVRYNIVELCVIATFLNFDVDSYVTIRSKSCKTNRVSNRLFNVNTSSGIFDDICLRFRFEYHRHMAFQILQPAYKYLWTNYPPTVILSKILVPLPLFSILHAENLYPLTVQCTHCFIWKD